MSPTGGAIPVARPTLDVAARADSAGLELKRGAFFNTIALLASNFRGVFTFLVARLLGAAALGTFSVAWATTDFVSKIGVLGLDNTISTFIARSEALGDRGRSRMLFRLAVALGLVQSGFLAIAVAVLIQLFGANWGLHPEMISALTLLLFALPGVALYRISTSVSRGRKVMAHDIYSRGIAEPVATTAAFVVILAIGFAARAPVLAAIVGTGTAGIVAFLLASKLFRNAPPPKVHLPIHTEAQKLLSFAVPVSVYQALNSLTSRLDLILLGFFVGKFPGLTLATVGVYGAAVEVANGARKVNQAFNPIFIPVVAGMTAAGEQERAAATYARLAQWMLWILLPLVGTLLLAGGTILFIYGAEFRQGSAWLGIVAVASATNAFAMLGETVIMVQRPRLNLLHSVITGSVAVTALLLLIPRFGPFGAALGILVAYIVQLTLRYVALRVVFRWKIPLSNVWPPAFAAIVAAIPALLCRLLLSGMMAEIASAAAFLGIFALLWRRSRLERPAPNISLT